MGQGNMPGDQSCVPHQAFPFTRLMYQGIVLLSLTLHSLSVILSITSVISCMLIDTSVWSLMFVNNFTFIIK